MPNFCSNYATLSGPKEKIAQLIEELKKTDEGKPIELLSFLRPNPSGEWNYDWSIDNWSTKWDTTADAYDVIDENTVTVSFESAWSPPIALYRFLHEQGWIVDAYYYEPGVGFCGRWRDGLDEEYDYSNMSIDMIRATIPGEIDDMFGIIDELEYMNE